ncbi:sesquipedalian-1-like [Agrilus planipennis]|uniref:Sesquipedalian-1-like n=1 Tax=Agrilus planipennis TaxID=224129 RepID=A0A1W4W481_AGRPL|nr:sesquipedalian-1-like [Agrilus planipennis]XP_025834821.1 sesquipedalian-1-like [Agrilus planipennis]
MKINEKNLSAFATAPTPIDKEGYLSKRGEVNKNFQRRYFVLKGNLLFYFEKKGDREPIGVIILEGCTIELAEDDEQFSFKIEFHGTNNRSYILAAESQEAMEQWMKALACASYDYMKLMVAELQRQLDDIEEPPLPVAPVQGSPVPPPRQRHNPFNKPDNNPHQRSHSMRSAPGRIDETNRQSDSAPTKASISFWELHNSYGRPILSDYNAWKHSLRLKRENSTAETGNLINL